MAKKRIKAPTVNVTPQVYTSLPTQIEEEFVTQTVGFDGIWYGLFAAKELDYREERNGASFAKVTPKETQTYRIIGYRDNQCVADFKLEAVGMNYHYLQPLPNDEFLLACARSQYRPNHQSDLNGHIYGKDGLLKRSILLGDGIGHLQTTEDSSIWAGYFDEGVFGNYGWGRGDKKSEPLGKSGLVAWTSQGKKQYSFEPSLGLDSICDCYALNVASAHEVWLCYYTEFPIVRIINGKVSDYWTSPIHGSHTFAVSYPYVVMKGGYNDHESWYLLQLEQNHQCKVLAKLQLLDEVGNKLEAHIIAARGDTLYLNNGVEVCVLTVGEVI